MSTKVTAKCYDESTFPSLYFTGSTDQKIREMISQHDMEVIFMLFVQRVPGAVNEYEVYNIFYPKQKIMQAAYCELDDYADTELFLYLFNRGRADETENIRGWAHSHVNMSAYFSGTDNATTNRFLRESANGEYYISAVFNKRMEHTIHLYDVKNSIRYEMPYLVRLTQEEELSNGKLLNGALVELANNTDLSTMDKIKTINQVCDVARDGYFLNPKITNVVKYLSKKRILAAIPPVQEVYSNSQSQLIQDDRPTPDNFQRNYGHHSKNGHHSVIDNRGVKMNHRNMSKRENKNSHFDEMVYAQDDNTFLDGSFDNPQGGF